MEFIQKIKKSLFYNSSVKQTILKNTFWLGFGQISSRALRAVLVLVAARILGPELWGAFSYALGIATFLTIFSDFGINALITKESVSDPKKRNELVSTAFFIKLLLILVIVMTAWILAPIISKIPSSKTILPILIFVFAFDTLRDLTSAIARSLEKMQLEAGYNILTNFLILILGILFLKLQNSGEYLALAYSLGSGLGFMAALIHFRENFKNLRNNFRKNLIAPIIKHAWPFGMLSVMGIVMLNTDVIILGWLVDAKNLGYYSAAQKLVQLLYVLPTLIGASIFPSISKFSKTDPNLAKKILSKSLFYSFLISIPIGLFGFLFSSKIISLAFGAQYFGAVLTFKILIWSVLIVYPSSILGQAVFAYGKEKSFIWLVVTTILGNAALDLILIPRMGIEGSAIATMIVQLFTNLYLFWAIKKVKTS